MLRLVLLLRAEVPRLVLLLQAEALRLVLLLRVEVGPRLGLHFPEWTALEQRGGALVQYVAEAGVPLVQPERSPKHASFPRKRLLHLPLLPILHVLHLLQSMTCCEASSASDSCNGGE